MRMIKLIASDLDGTLLEGEHSKISSRTLELVEKIIDKDIHFVVASGRSFPNQYKLFEPLRDRISYIAENGALCIHEGKVFSETPMPEELTKKIITELKKEQSCDVMVSCSTACFLEKDNYEFIWLVTQDVGTKSRMIDDISEVQLPILKIATRYLGDDSLREVPYLDYLRGLFGKDVQVVTSGNNWIDFMHINANKAIALKRLIDHLGIKPEECMAFGDQNNDMKMLELVGESYVMAKGDVTLRKVAKHVTDSVEDVLEKLLKNV